MRRRGRRIYRRLGNQYGPYEERVWCIPLHLFDQGELFRVRVVDRLVPLMLVLLIRRIDARDTAIPNASANLSQPK